MDLRKWNPVCDRCDKPQKVRAGGQQAVCICPKPSPPTVDYIFDEARRFAGSYTVSGWEAEDYRCKARAVAHFLEHNLRESWMLERARLDAKNNKDGKNRNVPHPATGSHWGMWRQGARG